MLREHTQVPRVYMELFAVLCIETSHYIGKSIKSYSMSLESNLERSRYQELTHFSLYLV